MKRSNQNSTEREEPTMGQEITHEIIKVTPDAAERWLADHNVGNRPLRAEVVATYSADFLSGRWPFAGDPIKFASDGRLLDGQHRLSACVATGVSFDALVVRGLSPDSQLVMDQGAKRSAGDHLNMVLDAQNSDKASAMARRSLLYQVNGGNPTSMLIPSKGVRGRKPTITEVVRWYEDNRSTIDVGVKILNKGKAGAVTWPVGALSAVSVGAVASGLEAELEQFVLEISAGGGGPHSASNVLRERRIAWMSSKSKPDAGTLASLTIHPWNKWIAEQEVRIMRIPPTGPMPVLDSAGAQLFPFPLAEPAETAALSNGGGTDGVR